jgi:hypothetical protein
MSHRNFALQCPIHREPPHRSLYGLTWFIVIQKFYAGCVICIEISTQFSVCIVMACCNFLLGIARQFAVMMSRRPKSSNASSEDVTPVKSIADYAIL